MIKLQIYNVNCFIKDFDDKKIIDELYDLLSYTTEEYINNKFISVRRRLLKKRTASFPTGLVKQVKNYLKTNEIKYKIVDFRDEIEDRKPLIIKNKTLRDYQKKAVSLAIAKKRGIVKVATGGGKTVISAFIIARANCKTMFCVHTSDLFLQAYRELKEILGIEIGRIGLGFVEIKQVNICMIQTLHNVIGKEYVPFDEVDKKKDTTDINDKKLLIMKFINSTECIIVDEVHHLKSDSYVNLMKSVKFANYKIGLSGTPYKDEGTDMLLEAYAGNQICNISASYLIRRGYLVQPTIIFLKLYNKYQYVRGGYQKIYKLYIVENERRNKKIVDYAKYFFEKKRSILITVSQVKHGKILQQMIKDEGINSELIIGEVKATKREELIEKVKSNKLKIIIGTSLADEGLDIPILDTLILGGSGRSNIRALQRIGRTLRLYPNKTKAIVIDFDDKVPFLQKHSRIRKSIYRKEEEFIIKEEN